MKTAISRLLIATMTLAFTAGVADAAHKKHKRIVRHHYPVAVGGAAAYSSPYASPHTGGPRPPWAAPWQCFTDEGYGRYRPCDAGPGSPR